LKHKISLFLTFILLAQVLAVISIGIITLPEIKEAEASEAGAKECADIVDNGDGTYTWTSATCRVWDGDSWEKWYLSQGFGASDETYRIANSVVGYELHKNTGNITYYNPYFNDTRVSMEHWTVEVAGASGAWHDTLIHTDTPTVSYHSNSSGLYLTMVKEKNDVRLELVHVIEYGKAMKHNLNIKSSNSTAYEYRLIQNWNGIQNAVQVVQQDDGTLTTTTLGSEVNSSASNGHVFIFKDSSGNSIVEESQLSAYGQFHHVLFGLSGGHGYAKYYFQNPTNQTLTSGQHFTVDPATFTSSGTDTGTGVWLGGGSGSNCVTGGWMGTAHGKIQVGREDSSRCYIEKVTYDISSIPDSAVITQVSMAIGAGHVNTGYCRGSGGSSNYGGCPLIDVTYLPNKYNDCTNDDSTVFEMIDGGHDGNGAASVVKYQQDPKDDWDGGVGSTVIFDYNSSYINTLMMEDLTADDVACFGYSETGDAQHGGGSNDFFQIEFPDITVTYSTVTIYTQTINLKTSDGSTALNFGDPELEIQMTNGTTLSYTNCVNSGGTIGTCTFSSKSDSDSSWEIRGKWANSGTPVAVMIEGKPSHNITVTSTQSHTLDLSLHKGTKMMFYDDNGLLASPQNVTTNFANGTSKNFATFDSAGARTIGWVTNGTNTVEAVYRLGNNRILNSSATFAVTGDSQSFSFKQKVYLLNFAFNSDDRVLQGIAPSAVSFSVNNGTVGDVFTPTSFTTPFQFGNDTITMKAIRFQGQNMVKNSTGFVVTETTTVNWVLQYFPVTWNFKSADHLLSITPTNFQHLAPNSTEIITTDFTKCPCYYGNGTVTPQGVTFQGQGMIKNNTAITINTAETNLINLKYFPVAFDFKSNDHALSITPTVFQFTAPNSTEVVMTSFTKTSYYGNGTLTPEGITYQGQGMIKNVTGITISSNQAHLFNLQYYSVPFNFRDNDHTVLITPTNFQFLAPNSTEFTITDFTKISYFGNGSLTPKGITYQGQGMIKNTTAVTIDSAETHLFNLKYYKQTFEFDSHDHVLKGMTPTVFQHTAPNGTEVFTNFAKPSYYGNGTLTPEGITFNGQGVLANTTGITISATDTHSWVTQWYKLNFQFYSNDGDLDITPTNMQLTFPNGTVIVMTSNFESHFVGNGTLTPAGITYFGTGMIANQTAITINDGGNPAKGYSFKLQFYKQTIVFASVDSALTIVPNNFQITLPNSTNSIITADFDSVYIGNGTITPLTITYLGQGVQVNNTAVTMDADETHLFRMQLYKRIFEFQSDDLVLNITPSLFQYTAPNGTVVDQTSHFGGHVNEGVYIGNGTLTPKGIQYQGSGMIKNVTALTISAGDTDLFRLRYYSIPLLFTSDDGALNITPARFQFTSVNGSEVQMTDFTKTSYFGNGSITPEGIRFLGQGVIKNNTAVTIDSAETHLFRLQVFKLNFDFASADSLLTPTPSQITYQAPNGTQIAQTSAHYNGHYVGNGTLTPQGITFQSTGMIKNVTAITIDASETHLLRMNYYKQDFEFRNTLSSSIITPTNFIITLANGTQVTLTSYTGYYFGNQTVASVDTITVGGLDSKKNATGFAIATDDDAWLFWALECCTVSFVFSSVDDVLQGIAPTTFEFDMGNGTYVILTSYSNVQFTDSDTVTPRAVRFQGQNMLLNSTAFTVDDSSGLSQTFKINIQYYRLNWDFASVDSELDLFTTLTNWQYIAPNGTAITQTVDLVGSYVGNGTLTPITLKYKGQGILVNNTGITIDSDETHLIRGQWYSLGFIFASNDHLLNITPDHIQFMAPNGTVIVFTNDAHFAGHYVGNGTITPQGITYLGQGMLKNQTGITISQAGNHLFNMQYYRVTINFVSNDGELALTPTNFKAVVANSTTPFTATHTTLYLGNGTLTPHVITWQSQNIISNSTAITIDADETWLIRGQYYRIDWDFLSDAGTLLTGGDAPDNFIFTLGNSTVVTQTTDMDGWYSANQTLTPFSILWDGTSVHKNQTQFSISDDGTLAMRTKVYTINFVFRSTDDVLTITPDNFIIVLSNTTEVTTTVPNRASGWLLANGTLTPNKIGFQGTNMILNATSVTLDASETHLFYMQYYPVTFEFKSDDLLLDIIPENMTSTGANSTVSTATSFGSAVYLGNQTTLVINQVNYQGTNMIKNTSSITISGSGTYLIRLQYMPIQIQFTTFNLNATAVSNLGLQLRVDALNGTAVITNANTTGGRVFYLGNGSHVFSGVWNTIRVTLNYSHPVASADLDLPLNTTHNAVWMPIRVFEDSGTCEAQGLQVACRNVRYAIEGIDIDCTETGRSNTTCTSFTNGQLLFNSNHDSRRTFAMQLIDSTEGLCQGTIFPTCPLMTLSGRIFTAGVGDSPASYPGSATTRDVCTASFNGSWTPATSAASAYCTVTYEFPQNQWNWNSDTRVLILTIPYQSGLNMTIGIPGTASYGSSATQLSLSQSQACLVEGDFICAIITPYTQGSILGGMFFVMMMSTPPLMVFLRTQSLGPAMILLMFVVYAYGLGATYVSSTSQILLPGVWIWFMYTLLVFSLGVTLYRLVKRGGE